MSDLASDRTRPVDQPADVGPSPAPGPGSLGQEPETEEDRRFRRCVDFVMNGGYGYRGESGFVDDPHDPGGATNRGITLETLARWRRLNHDARPVGADEVRALDDETAREIYRRLYWDAHRIGALTPGADLMVFDAAVNGYWPGIDTLMAAAAGAEDPVEALRALREQTYRHTRNRERFLKGWLSRLAATTKAARAMELAAAEGDATESG